MNCRGQFLRVEIEILGYGVVSLEFKFLALHLKNYKQYLNSSEAFSEERSLIVFDICFQDEFLDVIYWLRQVLAIILGVIWAIIPLRGVVGLVL